MDEVHGYHKGEKHHESHYDSCGHVAICTYSRLVSSAVETRSQS